MLEYSMYMYIVGGVVKIVWHTLHGVMNKNVGLAD